MRIGTFNLENLDFDPANPDRLEARVSILRPQLERLDADILCLQENNAQAGHDGASGDKARTLQALDVLIGETAYARYHRAHTTSPSGPFPKDRHNLVVLSRYPLITSEEIHHHLVSPPLYRMATAKSDTNTPADVEPVEWDRALLHVVVDAGYDRPVHVINLHLRAPRAAFIPGQKHDSRAWKTTPGWAEGFFLAAIKRAGQALEARLLIDRLFDQDETALIAVAGDFNADDHEVPARIIRGDEGDVGNPMLARRMLVPVERAIAAADRHSVIHGGRAQMLDHIFASRELMAFFQSSEVHNEMLGDEALDATAFRASPESYHAPMVAKFRTPDA